MTKRVKSRLGGMSPPKDQSCSVEGGTERLTDTEGLGALLEEGVLRGLGGLLGAVGNRGGLGATFGGFGLQVIETVVSRCPFRFSVTRRIRKQGITPELYFHS